MIETMTVQVFNDCAQIQNSILKAWQLLHVIIIIDIHNIK